MNFNDKNKNKNEFNINITNPNIVNDKDNNDIRKRLSFNINSPVNNGSNFGNYFYNNNTIELSPERKDKVKLDFDNLIITPTNPTFNIDENYNLNSNGRRKKITVDLTEDEFKNIEALSNKPNLLYTPVLKQDNDKVNLENINDFFKVDNIKINDHNLRFSHNKLIQEPDLLDYKHKLEKKYSFSSASNKQKKSFNLKNINNQFLVKISSYGLKENNYFIKNYKFLKQIGSGNFGRVGLYYSKLEYKNVVIKEIKMNDIKRYINYDNEILVLSALNKLNPSKYILKYYNNWKHDDLVYLVYEHCAFDVNYISNNSEYFKNEYSIIKLLRDICKNIFILNKYGIAHMDIKPTNILYGFDNIFKLCDYGLSRKLIIKHNEEIVEGDRKYIAPELLELPLDIDLSKCDIFSLGVSIIELLVSQKGKLFIIILLINRF